jgi:hypothetical protein
MREDLTLNAHIMKQRGSGLFKERRVRATKAKSAECLYTAQLVPYTMSAT